MLMEMVELGFKVRRSPENTAYSYVVEVATWPGDEED